MNRETHNLRFIIHKNTVALSENFCTFATMNNFRSAVYFKNYFFDFFDKQRQKVQKKIAWTIKLIEQLEKVPEEYLKHLEDGIYEVRVQQGSDIFRICSFFYKDQLIVLANGFQKKTQKVPREEIEKAKKIISEYEKEHK